MINRNISNKIQKLSAKFPVIELTGPRQSGKTTLAQTAFPGHTYISLEDLEARSFAQTDPKGFLAPYEHKPLIIDEAQHVPELFSYIQLIVDRQQQPGHFILTGSQNFLLHEKIIQSLAGRVALLQLLPLSLNEMQQAHIAPQQIETLLYTGGYPRIYTAHINPSDWYPNYIQTYVERDVRLIKNITDLGLFQRFLKMCAYRVGQLLNLSSLAHDCGITHNTAAAWLCVLETSYIAFQLRPHHKNFNKRLVKTPKLYFYDTGLLCDLLDIQSADQLMSHAQRGSIFENFVMTEIMKHYYNAGIMPSLYFWRDKTGHEVDCIIEKSNELIPIEIKSGKTITTDYFDSLRYWLQLTGTPLQKAYLIYAGDQQQLRHNLHITGWQHIPELLENIMR